MKDMFINKTMRLFIAVTAMNIWGGLYLTGFDIVHWFAYLPAIFLSFAAISSICPGYIISKYAMSSKDVK